ncbi:MAG: AAA family ATPase [Candidatus Odinarchaeota archaeon]
MKVKASIKLLFFSLLFFIRGENLLPPEIVDNYIGRHEEFEFLLKAIDQRIPVIIEGDTGTGKTEMAKILANHLNRPFYRVDGDESLTAHKIVGWFDPPLVLQKGFTKETFIPGSLTRAMEEGGIFFFNETNRAPSESVNTVLTAIEERVIYVPRLDPIKASENFVAIFTMNPLEHIATNPLPQAFHDRCVWLELNHQSLEEEIEIVKLRTGSTDEKLIRAACLIIKKTREHPELEAGSSVRGGIQLVKLLDKRKNTLEKDWFLVGDSVLRQKVKLSVTTTRDVSLIIREIIKDVLEELVEKKA